MIKGKKGRACQNRPRYVIGVAIFNNGYIFTVVNK